MNSGTQRRRELRDSKRTQLIAYRGGKCVKCGTTEELEFDHIDPKTKLFCVSQYLHRSLEFLIVEAEKCQLLCRACHYDKTSVYVTGSFTIKHGTWSTYVNYRCRCEPCILASRTYQNNRHQKLKDPKYLEKSRMKHGTRSMYIHGHCRCELCKEAQKIYMQDRQLKFSLENQLNGPSSGDQVHANDRPL